MIYKINIEEKVIANKKEHHDFCNVIATKEGTISKIIVKEGTTLVDINEHVNAGDILISGEIKYNDELKGLVCADGTVFAKTWYTVNISIPKTYKKIIKKDKYYNNIYITFNNKTKKLFNKKRNNIKPETTNSIKIFNIKIDKVKEYETKITTKQYTEKEIEDKIQELINKNLQPILKDNNHIIEQKVLKKNNFNSTIEVEIFIVVEEEIGHTIYTIEKDDNND